ncbi:hypothetical protein ACLMJK_009138 [Lecanora helva]
MDHDHNNANEHISLSPVDPTLSDLSSPSNYHPSPDPTASSHNRPGYQRVSTFQEEQDIAYHGAAGKDHGLGIHDARDTNQGPSIEVSFSTDTTPAVPNSSEFMLSPTFSRSSTKKYSPLGNMPEDEEFQPDGRSRSPSLYQTYTADPERERLRRTSRTSTLSPYGPTGGEHPEFACMTKQHFHHARGETASILILLASVWSTIFSAIWLGLATGKPHYGQMITDNSKLPPSTASLLVAAFAKSIELTFVTSFVAFLGQLLSQKAFRKDSNGVTVAEMQMRSWVLQPGTIITHSAAMRYAALTFMGATAFCAAILAMVYTTASDALVSPKLRYGPYQHRVLYGNVTSRFANETYIEDRCFSPIDLNVDPLHKGQTCIAIEHSGQAFHNYQQYLTNWTNYLNLGGSVSTNISERPLPVGTFSDNTSVTGSWIYPADMAADSKKFNRMVNNVTVAMPHSNIFAAAMHPKNKILQPQDLDGLGEYKLEASVPSPAVNVLCVALTKDELAPMVVSQWPAYKANTTFNVTMYPPDGDPKAAEALGLPGLPGNTSWLNATAVDDLFGFGEKYGRRAPYFPIIPEVYNTIMNYTSFPVEGDSLYVLTTANITGDSPYGLCSLRAFMEPGCSTKYHSTLSGGTLKAHCNDPHNPLAYSKSHPHVTPTTAHSGYNKDWRDVGSQWGIALSLNAGKTGNDASNARLISQFLPSGFGLDPKLPSMAEALGVMAGCTLLIGSIDSPFIHYWNYSSPDTLLEPAIESFNASLSVQDYSSGGTQHWQSIFYIVLAAVFLINLLCLAYFITHTGLVTDFMEPQNLFALSLNSPPSQVLEGTCGGGPMPKHYSSTWHIGMNRHEHFYIESPDDPLTRRRRNFTNPINADEGFELETAKSPVADMYNRISKKRSTFLGS